MVNCTVPIAGAEVWGRSSSSYLSPTLCKECDTVLSNLQRLSFHSLLYTYLDKVLCGAADSLHQQLCCSFIQWLKPSCRGVATKIRMLSRETLLFYLFFFKAFTGKFVLADTWCLDRHVWPCVCFTGTAVSTVIRFFFSFCTIISL